MMLSRITILTCFTLLSVTGCTARYKDLLRDRDVQIRELDARVADLRATNEDLERKEKEARAELEKRAEQEVAEPVEATAPRDDVDKVSKELPDLDVRYKHGRLSIGIENTVTFSSGSIILKRSAGEVLGRVARVLKRDFAEHRIYVEGHTDTDPIRRTKTRFRSNRHLSTERADVVAEYLVKKGGLPGDQIVVVGYGEFDPLDHGKSRTAKAHNRRVEIVVGEDM